MVRVLIRTVYLRNLHGYGKRQYKRGFDRCREQIPKLLSTKTTELRSQIRHTQLYKNARVYYCPTCNQDRPFYPISGRRAYSCQRCRFQVYPRVGTIFQKSTTPDHKWNTATTMISVNPKVSVRDIQRAIHVTYKTAWRMAHLIRGDQTGSLPASSLEQQSTSDLTGSSPDKPPRDVGKPK